MHFPPGHPVLRGGGATARGPRKICLKLYNTIDVQPKLKLSLSFVRVFGQIVEKVKEFIGLPDE